MCCSASACRWAGDINSWVNSTAPLALQDSSAGRRLQPTPSWRSWIHIKCCSCVSDTRIIFTSVQRLLPLTRMLWWSASKRYCPLCFGREGLGLCMSPVSCECQCFLWVICSCLRQSASEKTLWRNSSCISNKVPWLPYFRFSRGVFIGCALSFLAANILRSFVIARTTSDCLSSKGSEFFKVLFLI